jgi:hypothetical protein
MEEKNHHPNYGSKTNLIIVFILKTALSFYESQKYLKCKISAKFRLKS